MRDRALHLGTPLHDKNYIGHDLTVDDPPLDKFIMHELESPYHLDPNSFVKGKYNFYYFGFFKKSSLWEIITFLQRARIWLYGIFRLRICLIPERWGRTSERSHCTVKFMITLNRIWSTWTTTSWNHTGRRLTRKSV